MDAQQFIFLGLSKLALVAVVKVYGMIRPMIGKRGGEYLTCNLPTRLD